MMRIGTGLIGSLVAILIFGAASAATTAKALYSFRGNHLNGNPEGNIVFDAQGNIYGTLSSQYDERKHAFGGVFKLSPPAPETKAWTESEIATFDFYRNGAHPLGGLLADATGNFYGTTSSGQSIFGSVFELLPPTGQGGDWTLKTLYEFTESGPGPAYPNAGVIQGKNGNLYGTTAFTAHGANAGSIFELAPPKNGKAAWALSDLYDFMGGLDGAQPVAPLVSGGGQTFYGTTWQGGGGTLCNNVSGCGTVFRLTPPSKGETTWIETVLYAFSGGPDGAEPVAGVVLDKAGNIYGTTQAGGDPECPFIGCGVVFELSPPTQGQTVWTETVLYEFHGAVDGATPMGSLILDKVGNLYGVTAEGGEQGAGTVFELSPPVNGQGSWSESTLVDLTSKTGCNAVAALTLDAAVTLYGTASRCGSRGSGTVFRIKR